LEKISDHINKILIIIIKILKITFKKEVFMKKSFIKILSATLIIFIIGCATIMHGSTQEIGISSSPTGASIIIDNELRGNTPLVVNLSRKENHIIRIEMADYEPFEITTTKSVSSWIWGNIVFGGLIGLIVDASTGGLYKLSPEQVEATLRKGDGSFLYQKDVIYITTVFEPNPNWQKIATLKSKTH
jgi:hypothetical protein